MNVHAPRTRWKSAAAALTVTAVFCTAPAMAGGGSVTVTPASNIQATINSGLYAEIILEPGTYNQTIVIDAADAPLTLRSMNPESDASVSSTILDGAFLGDAVITLTAGVGPDVVIDGLTIRNGEALGASGPDNRGGAIDCEQASPVVRRCMLLDNEASSAGGAFYVNAGTVTIEDCTFMGNLAPHGGAVYCNNSTVSFVRCHFEANDATIEGGAARLYTGTYSLEECTVVANEAVTYGGGVAVRNGAMFSATQCWFESNFCGDGGAAGRGGAILHDGSNGAFVENSVFLNNSVTKYGASVYSFNTITVRNTTHYGDAAGGGASVVFSMPGGSHLNLHNSILWDYSAGTAIDGSGGKNVTYCDIQGGFAGAGNIGADSGDEPSFADAAGADFHLLAGSAGIDAGDAGKVLGEYPVDFDGNPRALNDPDTADSGLAALGISVDMGAYEYQPPTVDPPNDCPADLNGDDVIDVTDLLQLLGAWGGC